MKQTNRIRAEDHATIGLVITSLLTTGIFWKQASIVNRMCTLYLLLALLMPASAVVLGGAGLGSSIGLFTHYGRSFLGDPPEKTKIPLIVTPR